ncbi:MAG TPA: phosphatidylglycerol lysyltransferase domain-containing protein [Candidatus Cloacimonadota bacterium]|nr:phosphatidylglycerol lysyltransferase domain-containing protein [Candidatus Cloacimonadota bacterium]HPK40760.1 phosphatidylglycerol lysyltransferase domain-containing protein [Candidatus Cloacimonadota bacterium]
MNQFKTLTINDFELLKKYFTLYPQISCDYNISNLLTWGSYYKVQYAIIEDRLFFYNPQFSLLFFPIGKYFHISELCKIYHTFLTQNPNLELVLIPNSFISRNKDINEYCQLIPNLEWSDYVYLSENLVNMKGKKLAKKKNLISQFQRLYPNHSIEKISSSHKDEVLAFAEKWRENKNQIDVVAEFNALKKTFDLWGQIESEGLILRVDGHIAAFSIFSPQNQTMLTEHFEKFDFEIKGAAQMIVYEVAKYAQKNGYILLNREQDMDLEGLRQAKRSYEPLFLVEFFRIAKSLTDSKFVLAQ